MRGGGERISSAVMTTSDAPPKKRRYGVFARILIFSGIVVAAALSSRSARRTWTTVFPGTCAAASMAPPIIEGESFPARVRYEENPCERVSDGLCRASAGGAEMTGECRDGRMDGVISVKEAPSSALLWSAQFEAGFPRGELRIRRFPGHEDVFHAEGPLLHGPSIAWERDGERLVELSGRYEKGRRVGRFTRRVEGTGKVRSALVYDEEGLGSKEFFYCVDGSMKERRGERVVHYDGNGRRIAERAPDGSLVLVDAEGRERKATNPDEEPPCALP